MLTLYLVGLLLIAVVAWVVASPFFTAPQAGAELAPAPEQPWTARRERALAAIRDAEMDFHIGKLSTSDYQEMRSKLEAEALEAIRHVEEEENA